METLVAIVHILVALILIVLVLVQDSKSGSIGGAFGGGGSNSVLGATGATTLAQKMTRWTAVVFAGTCILLTMYASQSHKSILDAGGVAGAAPIVPVSVPATPNPVAPAASGMAPAETSTQPSATAPAATAPAATPTK